MTLGAVMIRAKDEAVIERRVKEISRLLKKELHCAELKHEQKVFFCREFSKLQLGAFGVISKKSTLGPYKNEIRSDSKKYYNKCAQYLLEIVGAFMKTKGLASENLTIYFERGNFDYAALRNFLAKCQENPKHPRTKTLSYIDIGRINTADKKEQSLLCLADLVAHALYKCVDKNDRNFGIPESRYFCEIRKKFVSNEERVEGFGLKAIHCLQDLGLDADIHAILDS